MTTSQRATPERRAHARLRGAARQAAYVDRNDRSLSALAEEFDAVLVFEDSRIRLVDRAGDIAFHPGLAFRRIERLAAGGIDPLVEIAGLRPGQNVLDGTLGLAQDALVAAFAVGPAGRVLGLEASAVLAVFVAEGLSECALPGDPARVITVEHGETAAWLATTSSTFDVAVLDPMFATAKRAQHSLESVRHHARAEPVTDELIVAAREKAARVVVKLGDRAALSRLRHRPDRVRETRSTVWAAFAGCGSIGA
ncbi:MAG TPA: class I SAM-dependent methyltransferase [Mycobacteriales bacterium]|nr:class I SAM-dependent methyltransferase [Mycobacteriales bacterium]